MRIIFDNQLSFGSVEIADIKIDPKSRDEIDKALRGLQYIYVNKKTKEEVFHLLKQILPDNISRSTGRPGMDMWKILVLGVIRLTCNWNYDTLHNMVNNHAGLREMLGHNNNVDWKDNKYYELQTIKDNVSLLPVEIIDQISEIVVKAGHELISDKKKEKLDGSVDSFVLETNIHFPTDIGLLYDSMRKAIGVCANLCNKHGIAGWRQSKHNIKSIKRQMRKTEKSKLSRKKEEKISEKGKANKKRKISEKEKEAHRNYISIVLPYIENTRESVEHLRNEQKPDKLIETRCKEIDKYLEYAEKHIDLIERRINEGETIPHSDKMFSIFEPHTRWISKGKAGVPVEFGLPVAIMKDQFGFILGHEVMETTIDVDIAVPFTKKIKEIFTTLSTSSYDKGYWSPSNYEELRKLLDLVVMPKKGRLSQKDRQIQSDPEFVKLRKKHSAVESSINGLEHSGLDKCLDHGIEGFKRYVSLAVLSRNFQTIGKLMQEKENKKLERKKTKKVA